MSVTAYLFEARSVQRFLFEGGKLVDMVVASNLLDMLCSTPLDAVVSAANLSGADRPEQGCICFSRRAGGAVFALFACPAEARRFQALWSLYVQQQFPGLEIVQHRADGETESQALKTAIEGLREARNRLQPRLPLASPLTRLSPRTGRPATRWDAGRKEWVDETLSIRREQIRGDTPVRDRLAQRFCASDEYTWPTDLAALFTDNDELPRVALVHADGNGIGELLRNVASIAQRAETLGASQVYRLFSEALGRATVAAAQAATAEVLQPVAGRDHGRMPARPLVLGGDDLTLLVRADLALPFTRAYCTAFETHTREQLAGWLDQIRTSDPDALTGCDAEIQSLQVMTACAGVAWIGASQPFLPANALAESLCAEAKKQARAHRHNHQANGLIPSAISFHRVSSPMIEPLHVVRAQEWTLADDREMSLGCYGVGEFAAQLPPLARLEAAAALFDSDCLNPMALRQVAMQLKENPALAEQRYQRWRAVSQLQTGHDGKAGTQLACWDDAIRTLCQRDDCNQIPFTGAGTSPLLDLLAVHSMQQGGNDEETAQG